MRAGETRSLNRPVDVRRISAADPREHVRGLEATIVDEIGNLAGVQAERLETVEEIRAAPRTRATRDVEVRTRRDGSAQGAIGGDLRVTNAKNAARAEQRQSNECSPATAAQF